MKTVAVVTGTRAEYGLLKPVLKRLRSCSDICLQLLVTGAHLSEKYGYTVQDIQSDGLPLSACLDILAESDASDPALATVQATAKGVALFGNWFSQNRPDCVLVLGDRYEIFAAVSAAALLKIPVAHISGGDVTYGAQDDWVRHAVTKMSALHFPYCDTYAKRLIRMGESPDRVHNVGSLGWENIQTLSLLSPQQLTEDLTFPFTSPFMLVTFHPETLSPFSAPQQIAPLLQAMEHHPEWGWCITGANADAGGEHINRMLRDFCARHANTRFLMSMGVLRYLSAMKAALCVVGNSSSGVVEAPQMGVPAVNIGDRQSGRLTCVNVINCVNTTPAIEAALQKAVDPVFQTAAHTAPNPFSGDNGSLLPSEQIVSILKNFLNTVPHPECKIFYDGKQNCNQGEQRL